MRFCGCRGARRRRDWRCALPEMIRLESLTKAYASPQGTVAAVDRVNLEVREGEACVLLGPSGCGKTTTLRMINRLVAPTSGRVFIAGQIGRGACRGRG